MKTFKMISFKYSDGNGNINELPLIDGILINQENVEQTWILEVFIDEKYKAVFEKFNLSDLTIDVQAVISFPENEPAPFTVKVIKILPLDNQISVLMKGKINVLRQKYAEKLLKNLLEDDLTKEELLNRFIQGMKERPKLKS